MHRGAGPFCHIGTAALTQNRIESFHRDDETGTGMRQQRAGDVWGWAYNNTVLGACVWCGIDAGGTLQLVWEAEEPYDPVWRAANPIYTKNAAGKDCLPGGTFVRMVMPDETILATLEAEIVSSGAQPAWVASSSMAGEFSTTADLLEQLFLNQQGAGGYFYGRYAEYGDFITSGDLPLEAKQYLTLLWLRAASMILFNHAEPSMIPLAMGRFTVDSDGVVTISE